MTPATMMFYPAAWAISTSAQVLEAALTMQADFLKSLSQAAPKDSPAADALKTAAHSTETLADKFEAMAEETPAPVAPQSAPVPPMMKPAQAQPAQKSTYAQSSRPAPTGAPKTDGGLN